MDFFKIAAVGIFQSVAHIVCGLLGAVSHQVNQWQGRFAFCQIVADVFADFFGFARVVQYIVNDLESRTDVHTVVFQGLLVLGEAFAKLRRLERLLQTVLLFCIG